MNAVIRYFQRLQITHFLSFYSSITSDHYTHSHLPAQTVTEPAVAALADPLPVAAEILPVETGNLAAEAACRSRLEEERPCHLVKEGRPYRLVRILGVGRGVHWGGWAFGERSQGGHRLGLGEETLAF